MNESLPAFLTQTLSILFWVAGLICIPIASWFHRVITLDDIKANNINPLRRGYGLKVKEVRQIMEQSEGHKKQSLKRCLVFRRLSIFFLTLGAFLIIVLPIIITFYQA